MEGDVAGGTNPYGAPKSAVHDPASDEYQAVKAFSVSGRIGRVRYIGYTIGFAMLVGAILGIIGAGLGGGTLATIFMVGGYAALFGLQIMLTIQRCHDFNASGWLSVLAIVPLVGLIFWFIPGTDGANRFGAKTPPNSTANVVLASILPLIFVVGIVAAIALPAYQSYVKRAQQSQQQR
jgi:uncharacterized membrane protein YhaH (DUF805 family)